MKKIRLAVVLASVLMITLVCGYVQTVNAGSFEELLRRIDGNTYTAYWKYNYGAGALRSEIDPKDVIEIRGSTFHVMRFIPDPTRNVYNKPFVSEYPIKGYTSTSHWGTQGAIQEFIISEDGERITRRILNSYGNVGDQYIFLLDR